MSIIPSFDGRSDAGMILGFDGNPAERRKLQDIAPSSIARFAENWRCGEGSAASWDLVMRETGTPARGKEVRANPVRRLQALAGKERVSK
jgi:hypothetical protein